MTTRKKEQHKGSGKTRRRKEPTKSAALLIDARGLAIHLSCKGDRVDFCSIMAGFRFDIDQSAMY